MFVVRVLRQDVRKRAAASLPMNYGHGKGVRNNCNSLAVSVTTVACNTFYQSLYAIFYL